MIVAEGGSHGHITLVLELANGELTVAWVRGMTYLKKNVVLRSAQRTFTSPGPWPLILVKTVK